MTTLLWWAPGGV